MDNSQPGSVVTPGTAQPETSWQFQPQDTDQPAAPAAQPQPPTSAPADTGIHWTASEFISHDKSAGWYGLLIIATAIAAGLIYLFTHGDKISTGMAVIVAIVFGIFAARKPRELEYNVDERGIRIASKFYPYGSFRSFSVVQEEGVESIWFIPLKRFMPTLSIYFDPTDGQKITDVLSKFLPLENRQLDLVDKLMHRLRF